LIPLIMNLSGTGCKRQEVRVKPTPPEIEERVVLTREKLARLVSEFYGFQGSNYHSFVIKKGIFPGTKFGFYGADTVRRFQFAIVLSRIVFEKGLEGFYREVRIPSDVPSDAYYLNAVKLCLGLDLIKLHDNRFMPHSPVYVDEAVNALKRIRRLDEMEDTR